MIKGIFFDFDRVITVEGMGSPTIIAYIASQTGFTYKTVETAYQKYNKQLLLGEITHKDMWQDFCRMLGKPLDFNILADAFLKL